MNASARVCVIGQVLLDVMQGPESRTRLGGIMHTATSLWAIGSSYCLGYLGPQWLDGAVEFSSREWGKAEAVKVGNTTGSPNVIVASDPKEVGDKQYELLWRNSEKVEFYPAALRRLLTGGNISDIIVFPDRFELSETLAECGRTKARVYADINFGPHDFSELAALGRKFETLIISTSAHGFRDKYENSPDRLCGKLFKYCKTVLLKENRGGARLFGPRTAKRVIDVPAQVRPIAHSVGVGDCFNAVFAVMRPKFGDKLALNYASSVAAEYATCTHPEEIREVARAVLDIDPREMADLAGVVLPWEKRSAINIYIAAPDFDWVDRGPIDDVVAALSYHNFTPRLPVRENGQMKLTDSPESKSGMASADLRILSECGLLVAVMLYDDPGTLIEIGLALERQIPVLVYDPYGRASNLMLTELPNLVSDDLDQIIAGVFKHAARVSNG